MSYNCLSPMHMKLVKLLPATALVWLGGTGFASAELVFFTSGRAMSIKSHRTEGDSIVLALRGGGEVVFAKDFVARIAPDEVPYVEPVAEKAPAATLEPDVDNPPPSAPVTAKAYSDIINTVSARHKVDPRLVSALIQVESAYRPRARSHKGAMGLMQLMPGTARQYDVRDPYDPGANIEGGVKHLRSLLDRFDIALALAAYNAGEAAVQRFGGMPPYRETRDYVRRILRIVNTGSR
jgi:hypothetical protein